MDCSHDKKRVNAEEDRLSSLPDGLIHKILSFISIKQAVETSVLSSRYRYIWTSMPYLNFSNNDFFKLPKLSKFITHFLSGRNNQTEVSSVNLTFDRKNSDEFVEQITEYAFSHNIQQLYVSCLPENNVEFPPFLKSCRSLKHFSLTKENFSRYSRKHSRSYVIKATSTWDLPVLTTLFLHDVTFCCDEDTEFVSVFSKCTNLKNLTLKDCDTEGSKSLSICLPLLYSLTLDHVWGSVKVFNIVTPQLKNLTIKSFIYEDYHFFISAPDLSFFLYKDLFCLQLSTNGFPSLEKADICVSYPSEAHQIVCLLQLLHNVKHLTLNLEIVELLSSSTELMSQQPSPFANLKSLKIHPEREEHESVEMSAEVKSYLLDSSPDSTFTMVTREDIRAIENTKLAQNLIIELRDLLEKKKASTNSKMAKMHELSKPQVDGYIHSYINMSWNRLNLQIEKEKEKFSDIISQLIEIKHVLRELPASNRAMIQPSFSNLCEEVDIVMNKITDFMKMNCDVNQRHLSASFHEFATTL